MDGINAVWKKDSAIQLSWDVKVNFEDTAVSMAKLKTRATFCMDNRTQQLSYDDFSQALTTSGKVVKVYGGRDEGDALLVKGSPRLYDIQRKCRA